jgi:hypothetical protein
LLAAERAWVALFGALAFSSGHGVFLVAALTRFSSLPSRAELGSALETAVVGWFVLAAPLALACAALRRRFLALAPRAAWSLAALGLVLAATSFTLYLRAVAFA